MHHRTRAARILCALLLGALASLVLSACGGSSGDANSLLRQTFSGKHTVNSGNLNFAITLSPSGSKTLTGPLTISFGGPFQSLGPGKLPKSNFTVSFSALGKTGSLGILSTGTSGYVTLQGASYQLPAATFQKLESSFSQFATSGSSSGSGSGALSKLGIDPMHWLTNPSVVGNESVGGSDTTHIKAGVNVPALLTDLNTFLQKASSLGTSATTRIPSSISATSRQKIAAAVKNPTFDVWTGTGDKTVRKLSIQLTLPVTGQFSTLLGGLQTAQIGITMQYANLNQPQTISAPASVRPYSEFQTKLRTILGAVAGAVNGSGLTGAGTGAGGSLGSGTTGSTGSTGTGSSAGATGGTGTGGAGVTGGTGTGGASPAIQSYTQCIQSAGGDITKMQQCAALLNNK